MSDEQQELPPVHPLAWVVITAIIVVLVLGFGMAGAHNETKAQELKQRMAEQSALLKMKEPIKMASEAAILATVWEKNGQPRK